MITRIIRKIFKKQRKYPVRRDEYGRTLRQITFDAFDRGMSSAQVSDKYGIKIETARRYYCSWRKLPPKFEMRYQALHELLQKHPDSKRNLISATAESLDMPVGEVVQRLQKPWGLRKLLAGKWPDYADEEIRRREQARLDAALSLIKFMEFFNMSPEELEVKIRGLIDEAIEKDTAEQQKGA